MGGQACGRRTTASLAKTFRFGLEIHAVMVDQPDLAVMLVSAIFPSSTRRGGRDIKQCREASLEERTGWSRMLQTFCTLDHPVCGAKDASRNFLEPHPPLLVEEGTVALFSTIAGG